MAPDEMKNLGFREDGGDVLASTAEVEKEGVEERKIVGQRVSRDAAAAATTMKSAQAEKVDGQGGSTRGTR